MQVLIVAALAFLSLAQVQAREARDAEQTATTTTTTTTQAGESLQLDDPLGVSDTTSNQDDSSAMDDICVRCYDKVKVAQDLVDVYESLLRKQKKLISRKKAAALASEQVESRPRSAKSPRSASGAPPQQNSTVRSRTLLSEPIVVSRLRVARSPSSSGAPIDHYASSRPGRVESSSTGPTASAARDSKYLNKKDQELERLKREQQRQKEATCRALLEVRDCLDLLSRECIGNLQFHSYEVFTDQYHGKFRCPYPNHPGLKPLPGLLPRSMADEEQARVPVPRPISSDEEVRQRLQKILPDRQFPRPLGVMLKPTLANPAGGVSLSKQSQSQPLERHAAAFKSRDLTNYVISPGAGPTKSDEQNQLYFVNVGKLLLVPCCLAIMVACFAIMFASDRK